jgi:hypothetical protein
MDIAPTLEQVMAHLYPPCRRKAPAERFVHLAKEMIRRARSFLEPRGATNEVGLIEHGDGENIRFLGIAIVGLATIGPRLEEEVRKLEGPEKIFLDACGSAAVEVLCDRMDALITEEVTRRGMRRTKRASPGHAPFPIEKQRLIFEMLPAAELGVELTPGLMMKPVKSASFFLLAGENPSLPIIETKCGGCPILNCVERSK